MSYEYEVDDLQDELGLAIDNIKQAQDLSRSQEYNLGDSQSYENLESLRNRLTKSLKKIRNIASYKEKEQLVKQDKEYLEKDLEDALEEIKRLGKRCDELTKYEEHAEKAVHRKDKEMSRMKEEIERFKRELHHYELENQNLQSKNVELELAYIDYQKSLESLQKDRDMLIRNSSDNAGQINFFTVNNEKLEDEKKSFENHVKELHHENKQLRDIMAQKDASYDQGKANLQKSLYGQMSEVTAKYREAMEENSLLKKLVETKNQTNQKPNENFLLNAVSSWVNSTELIEDRLEVEKYNRLRGTPQMSEVIYDDFEESNNLNNELGKFYEGAFDDDGENFNDDGENFDESNSPDKYRGYSDIEEDHTFRLETQNSITKESKRDISEGYNKENTQRKEKANTGKNVFQAESGTKSKENQKFETLKGEFYSKTNEKIKNKLKVSSKGDSITSPIESQHGSLVNDSLKHSNNGDQNVNLRDSYVKANGMLSNSRDNLSSSNKDYSNETPMKSFENRQKGKFLNGLQNNVMIL